MAVLQKSVVLSYGGLTVRIPFAPPASLAANLSFRVGITSMRRGNIKGHRNAMLGLYFGAILIAGGLTLLPGRLLHRVLFG